MVFITAFLFSSSVWTLSKYLQEEPQTATCKEMRGRADRVSTNGKSEGWGVSAAVSLRLSTPLGVAGVFV